MSDVGLPIIVLGLFILFIWALFYHIGNMARDRGHNPWAWWLISLFWSPFGSIFIMWLFFPRLEDTEKEKA